MAAPWLPGCSSALRCGRRAASRRTAIHIAAPNSANRKAGPDKPDRRPPPIAAEQQIGRDRRPQDRAEPERRAEQGQRLGALLARRPPGDDRLHRRRRGRAERAVDQPPDDEEQERRRPADPAVDPRAQEQPAQASATRRTRRRRAGSSRAARAGPTGSPRTARRSPTAAPTPKTPRRPHCRATPSERPSAGSTDCSAVLPAAIVSMTSEQQREIAVDRARPLTARHARASRSCASISATWSE